MTILRPKEYLLVTGLKILSNLFYKRIQQFLECLAKVYIKTNHF